MGLRSWPVGGRVGTRGQKVVKKVLVSCHINWVLTRCPDLVQCHSRDFVAVSKGGTVQRALE